LIADLKSFPFQSATFRDVREFTLAHGGAALQEFPPPFPRIAVPERDPAGKITVPLVSDKPVCNHNDCTFQIWILPMPQNFGLGQRAEVLLLSAMYWSGIKPWGVYVRFKVSEGRLEESLTSVGGLERSDGSVEGGLMPFEYDIITSARPIYGGENYSVGKPHVTGGPLDILEVRMTHTSTSSVHRAFDINLGCLNRVLAGCTLAEIAPSAWSDYTKR
jgi:hypothetical protein